MKNEWKDIAMILARVLESEGRTEEGDGSGVVLPEITEAEADELQEEERTGFAAFRKKVAKIIGGE